MADETDTTEQPNSLETENPNPTEKPAEEAPVEKPAEPEPDKEADKSLMTGGKPPEDEEEEEPDEAAELPDKYDLTPPEGFEVNDEILAEADPIFRELKLTNEQANKLMPLAGTFAKRLFSAQQDAFQAQATDWAKTAKADAELGGRNWQETETLVAKALDHFAEGEGGAKFRTLLDETKLGNHPEMIRMFRKIGVALSEDGAFPRSDASAQVKQPREAVLYPEDAPKEGAN
jgi:hypothetical protein